MPHHVVTLPANVRGRDFVVGDIHGGFDLLEQALKQVKFDPARDRLISVGDLIDRGGYSPRCLWYLQQPWFHATRGNHEEMFMKFYRGGKFQGGQREKNFALQVGMGWMFGESRRTLGAIRAAFEKLPLALEFPGARGMIGIVHAEVPAGMGWSEFKQALQDEDPAAMHSALWSRDRIDAGDLSGVPGIGRVFHGHTPQERKATQRGNCFYIDTGGVFGQIDDKPGIYFLTLADANADPAQLTRPLGKKVLVHTIQNGSPAPSSPAPRL
jgi:serine/threonine protein phosphatase 1